MATWNLESVGTKGYGGGGSYLCARAARKFLNKDKDAQRQRQAEGGVFNDPLMDSCYGQCSSSLRENVREDFSDLVKPNELEEALAMARASAPRERPRDRGEASVRGDSGYEDVKVKFEQPFTSKDSRGGKGIPLVCLGTTEHAVYAMSISYNGRVWSVERRYSEFVDLDKELMRIYGRDSTVRILVLPSKKWVGTLSKELLESRRRDLEAYIKGLVSQGALVWKCDSLRAFLELPPRPDGARGAGGKQHAGNGGKGKGDSFDSDADDMLRL